MPVEFQYQTRSPEGQESPGGSDLMVRDLGIYATHKACLHAEVLRRVRTPL